MIEDSGGDTIKTLTVRLDDETHMAFKIYAAKAKRNMQDILKDYIRRLLQSESRKEKK